MLRLLLLRHAKSLWPASNLPDIDRPLAPRGVSAAASMARYIADRRFLPDTVLCSPARRTRETMAPLIPFLSDDVRIAITPDLYDQAGADYRAVIAENAGSAKELMVIGHNPAIQATALLFVGGGDPSLAADLAHKYPTGALAVLEFDTAGWAKLEPQGARIVAYIKPRDTKQKDGSDPADV